MHCSGSSRARNEERHLGTLSAVTCTSPHRAWRSSRGVTIWPAWARRRRSAASSLGGRWTTASPRRRVPSAWSRKPAKESSPFQRPESVATTPGSKERFPETPVSGDGGFVEPGKADEGGFSRSNAAPSEFRLTCLPKFCHPLKTSGSRRQ